MIPMYDIIKLRNAIKTQKTQTIESQRGIFFPSEQLQIKSFAEERPIFRIYKYSDINPPMSVIVLDIDLDELMFSSGYQKVRTLINEAGYSRDYKILVQTLTGGSAKQSIAQFGTPDYYTAQQDFNEIFSFVLQKILPLEPYQYGMRLLFSRGQWFHYPS